MRAVQVFFVLSGVVAAYAGVLPSLLANIDVTKYLQNDNLVSEYVGCVLDETACNLTGKLIKKTIPGLVTSGCSACSPKEKELFKTIFKHLTTNKPEEWKKLSAKYDPTGEYTKKYGAEYGLL